MFLPVSDGLAPLPTLLQQYLVDGEGALDPLAGLQVLLDTSLLEQREGEDGEPRFSMLETIREYALERLEVSGEQERLQSRHAGYFLALAETSHTKPNNVDPGVRWDRLEEEHANLRAALAWGRMDATGDTELRLALALGDFWHKRGHLTEGYGWLADAVGQTGVSTAEYHMLRARALDVLGATAIFQGDLAAAQPWLEQSLQLYRELGDCSGEAEVLADLGMLYGMRGNFEQAWILLDQSLILYRGLGNVPAIAGNFFFLGNLTYAQGHSSRAGELWEESRRLTPFDAASWWVTAALLHRLGMVALDQGEYSRAGGLLAESLTLLRDQGERWEVLTVLEVCARLAAEQGHRWAGAQAGGIRAARLLGASEALRATYSAPVLPDNQDHYERSVAAAHAHLDEATFAAAWAEGRALTLEQAIAYALDESNPESSA